jgi:hypothetical protein
MKIQCDITIEKANNLLTSLILFELCLFVIYLASNFLGHPTKFFDLDGEANLPAWFSSMQYLIIAQLILFKVLQPHYDNTPPRSFLKLVSAGFIFLSADEAAQIHETLSGILKRSSTLPRFNDGNGIWIFVYAFIGIFMLYVCYRNLIVMWARYRRETIIVCSGFSITVFGAVFLEIISYQYLRTNSTVAGYVIEVAFEELFEMVGASIMMYGALLFLLHESSVVAKASSHICLQKTNVIP